MRNFLIILTLFTLTGCGSDRDQGITGPGNTTIGDSVTVIETAHPRWHLEKTAQLSDGREARQYKNHEWNIWTGVIHAPVTLYFRNGRLESWSR